MRARSLLLTSIVLLASVWPGRAGAHPATLAYCTVRSVLGGLEAEFDLPLHGPIAAEALAAALLQRVRAGTPQGACRGRVTRARIEPRRGEARGTVGLGFECPPGPVTLTNEWGDAQSETLCAIDGAPWVFRRTSRAAAVGTPPRAAPTSLEYARRGARGAVSHVGHAVFLALLLVVALERSSEHGVLRTLGRALAVTAAFTAGSAITLALSALDLVRVAASVVASLVALSILVVALENLLIGRPRWRSLNAALFGLVHGCALAAVLERAPVPNHGLLWAASGFGAGFLLAQAAFGLVLAALLIAPLRQPWYRRGVVLPLSAASVGLAGFVLLRAALGLPAPAWFAG